MKRLLEQIGLTYLSVLAVVFYFGKVSAFIVGAISLVLVALFFSIKRCRKTIYLPAMACVALIACIVNIMYTTFVYEKTVEKYDGCSEVVVAKLVEEPYKTSTGYRYKFKTETIGESKEKIRFMSYHDELLNIEPFDVVRINVEFYGATDNIALKEKCFLSGYLDYENPEFTVLNSEKSLYYYAIKIRQCIRGKLSDVLSAETFPLCSALLIGDKNLLSYEIRNQFVKAGASHLIVVSGMHFSILASIFFLLARRNYSYRHIVACLATLFILLYMSVVGYTPSVLRSGVMLLVCCLALSMSNEPYSGNSLGLAAFVCTLTNPYSVGDVGLLLSFTTTFSIIYMAPYLMRKFRKVIRPLRSKKKTGVGCKIIKWINKLITGTLAVLSMNISAAVASIPLSILFFDSLSSVSVLSTFILYLPVQFLLILTFVIAILSFIPFIAFLLPILSFVADLLSGFIFAVVDFFASLPFSYITVKHSYIYLFIFMCLVLLLVTVCSDRKNKAKVFILSVVFMLLTGHISATVLSQPLKTLNVYDVDNGMAVLYSDSDVSAVLALECNSKNRNTLINELQSTVSEIDFCASLSNTSNGANTLSSLSKVFAISDVLLYDTKRTVTLSEATGEITTPDKELVVHLSDEEKVTYTLIDGKYVAYFENEQSTVLVLPSYVDVENISEEYRSADVIIVNTCNSNFELLSCDTLIISAKRDTAYNIMKYMSSVCGRVMLTAENDIKIYL